MMSETVNAVLTVVASAPAWCLVIHDVLVLRSLFAKSLARRFESK